MRTVVLITGASRGFGRCLAVDFTRELQCEDVDLHLWARHAEDLKETERLAHVAWNAKKEKGVLRTFVSVVDLSDKLDYVPKVDSVLAQMKAGAYDRIYLVHNAGSLGQLGFTQEWDSYELLKKYNELNVISVFWINNRFLRTFGATRERLLGGAGECAPPPAVILNITSLCGIEPFQTHGMYCAGKAAREMHHHVIAMEQNAAPNVRVLSYSPGPMDTDMQKTIRESSHVLPELAQAYASMKEQGKLILPAKSSLVGVKLTLSGEFKTGSHVDYYDIVTNEPFQQ